LIAEPALMGANFIQSHCINRHEGGVNSLFVDFSARKVGLKQLWTFEWRRGDDTANMYSIAGYGGNEAACAAYWDSQVPWMKDFPEY